MHPSQERRDMHPLDAVLRRHGFRIHSRAKGQQAVWQLGGKLYDRDRALEAVGIDHCTGVPRTAVEEVVEIGEIDVGQG